MLSRRFVWPLVGVSVLLLTPGSAPARPTGGVAPQPTNAVPIPDNMQKLTTPVCSVLPGETPQRFVPTAARTGTEIKAKFAVGAIGATIPVRATLTTEDGAVVPFQPIEFKVEGQIVGTADTNSKGEATIEYKVPNKFGPKPFVARFAGNSKCAGADDSSSIGTVRSSTTFDLDLSNYANVGSKTRITGRLTRITDGASISGREVEIYVQGKQVSTAVTSGSGYITADYTPTTGANKPLDVKVQFLGDVLYNPTAGTGSTPLYPPRESVYVKAGDVAGRYGDTVSASVIVIKGPSLLGPKYAGAPVRVLRERGANWAPPRYDAKQVGAGTTNTFGLAQVSFKITDKPMKYSLWAYADVPRERYDVVKGPSAYLTVLKAPVQLVVSGPTSVHISESASYTVKAKRVTDSQAIEDLRVCFGSSCQDTDSQGKATITFTVPSAGGTGSRVLSFTSTENDYHLAGAQNLTVQALPSTN